MKKWLLVLATSLAALPTNPTANAELTLETPKDMLVKTQPEEMVHWASFSIDEGESVRFLGKHDVFNKVIGPERSDILGKLSAEGRIFLVNPNGIFIGPTGRIESAGFIASTIDLSIQGKIGNEWEKMAEDNPYALAIRHEGLIEAQEVRLTANQVYLKGHIESVAGDVEVRGNEIFMHPNATIVADAKDYGDGGRVILFAEEVLHAHGKVSVRGGASGGNGGFVETSSKGRLDTRKFRADRRAPYGKWGELLIDPTDVTISVAAFSNATFNMGTDQYIGTDGSATANVDSLDLQGNLELGPVTIDTNETVGGADSWSMGGGSGTIQVLDSIIWNAPNLLTLHANDGIIVTENITISCTAMGAGTNTVIHFQADGNAGNVESSHGILLQSGVVISASSGTIFMEATTTSTSTVQPGSGILINQATIEVENGGSIRLVGKSLGSPTGGSGNANIGVSVGGTSDSAGATLSATGAGTITIIGSLLPADVSYTRHGAGIVFNNAVVNPGSGGMDLTGTSTAPSGNLFSYGVCFQNNCSSTATANVVIQDTHGGDGQGSRGVVILDSLLSPGWTLIATDNINANNSGSGGINGNGFQISNGLTATQAVVVELANLQINATTQAVSGTFTCSGVFIYNTSMTISGEMEIQGNAASGGSAIGVGAVFASSNITCPSITAVGVSAASGGESHGVLIQQGLTIPSTGTFSITQAHGGSGDSSDGVRMQETILATNTVFTVTNSQSSSIANGSGLVMTGPVTMSFAALSASATTAAAGSDDNAGIKVTGPAIIVGGDIALNGSAAAGSGKGHGVMFSTITIAGGGSGSTVDVSGSSLALTASSNGVQIQGGVTLTTVGALSITGSSATAYPIGIADTLNTANTAAFNSAVQLLSTTVTITSNGTQNFASTINGANALVLSPTSNNLVFSGAIGNTATLTTLQMTTPNNVTAVAINATNIVQTSGAGISTFNGTITVPGSATLGGSQFAFNAPVNGGTMSVSNTATVTIATTAPMVFAASFSQTTANPVVTGGNMTATGNINVTGPVTLTATISYASIGDTTFDNTMNGAFGLTVTGANVTYGNTVGATTPLTRISTTATTTIFVDNNQTVSAGPMTYVGTVQLTNHATFTCQGSGSVTFSGSPNAITRASSGAYNCGIVATLTTVGITGETILDGIVAFPNGSYFDANAGLGFATDATITSQGYSGGGDGGYVHIQSAGGSISVFDVITSGAVGDSAGTITLEPSPTITSNLPIGLAILNGNLTADNGTTGLITIGAVGGRGTQPRVATIVSSQAGNDITIEGYSFVMKENEAFTCFGNLTITGVDSLSLGDLVSVNDMTLTAPTITQLSRNPTIVPIYDYLGELYNSTALHFLTGDGASYTGPPESDTLHAGSSGVAEGSFRARLLMSVNADVILNFDLGDTPVPPSPEPTPTTAVDGLYFIGVAGSQLFYYYTPIYWQDFAPPYYLINGACKQ